MMHWSSQTSEACARACSSLQQLSKNQLDIHFVKTFVKKVSQNPCVGTSLV
jgi:hypothetical protein